jgi:hypothetical protein
MHKVLKCKGDWYEYEQPVEHGNSPRDASNQEYSKLKQQLLLSTFILAISLRDSSSSPIYGRNDKTHPQASSACVAQENPYYSYS